MTSHQSSLENVKTFLRNNNLDRCSQEVIRIGGDSLINLSYATPELLSTNGIRKIWARCICHKMKNDLKMTENWSSINQNSVEEFLESIDMGEYNQVMVENLGVVSMDMLQFLTEEDMVEEGFLKLHAIRIMNIIENLQINESQSINNMSLQINESQTINNNTESQEQKIFTASAAEAAENHHHNNTSDLHIQEQIGSSSSTQSTNVGHQEQSNQDYDYSLGLQQYAGRLVECSNCGVTANSQRKTRFSICYYCDHGGVVCSEHIGEHNHNYVSCVIPFSAIFGETEMKSDNDITCAIMSKACQKMTNKEPNTRYCKCCNKFHASTAYRLCPECRLVMDKDCFEKYHRNRNHNNHQIVQIGSFTAKVYRNLYHQVVKNKYVLTQAAINGAMVGQCVVQNLPSQMDKIIMAVPTLKPSLSVVSKLSHSVGPTALHLTGAVVGVGAAVLAFDIACLAKRWLWNKEMTCKEFFKSSASSIVKNGIIITCSVVGSGLCPVIGSVLGAAIGVAVVKGLEWLAEKLFKRVDQEKTTAVIAAIDLGVIKERFFSSTQYEHFFYYDKDLQQITVRDVKNSFNKKIREVHPDKNQSETAQYEQLQAETAKLILAKEILIHYLQTRDIPNSNDTSSSSNDARVPQPITLPSSN